MSTTEERAWELAQWDAVETAAHLKKRDVSVPEVIEAAITRARAAEKLGAVVTPTFERALLAAMKPAVGPLAGVPMFTKDLTQVEGVRTGWGSAAAGEYISTSSDPTVKIFERTGMISLGKSSTPELGLTATTEPLGVKPTRNPWNPEHSTGGSSGGAAALVASGVVPLSHASDGGGSVRIPASCCGLVGLKVTRGRFDMEGSNLLPVNIAVHGCVTRTVRDTIAFWEAVEQHLPHRKSLPPIGPVAGAPARKLRVAAFTNSPMGRPVHPEVVAATEKALKLCEELGHQVELIACPVEKQVPEDFMRLWGFVAFVQSKAGRVLIHRGWDASKLEPWTIGFGRYFTDAKGAALASMSRLRGFKKTWASLISKYDVMLSPTLAQPPARLGHLATDLPFDVTLERVIAYVPFTALFNASGAPAISLPLGQSSTGLPVGVQFAGAWGSERLLLGLARSIEEARPWAKMAPRERWA